MRKKILFILKKYFYYFGFTRNLNFIIFEFQIKIY